MGDEIQVATNPEPTKAPIGGVHPRKYVDYKLVPDLPMAARVIDSLRAEGFKLTMLTKIPIYRDAHATDDHLMSAMFVAGLLGSAEDIGTPVELGAEDWELTNMYNSQYTFGNWKSCHGHVDSVGGSLASAAARHRHAVAI